MMGTDKQRRTLILSVFFSSLGPIITLVAVFMSNASTQVADFIRRSVELFVLIMALIVYQKLKSPQLSDQRKQTYKTIMSLSLIIVLSITTMSLLTLVIYNINVREVPEGTVWLGLLIAFLGVFFNGAFWWRYSAFDNATPHMVMRSQKKLYQAKTLVDINVVLVLGSIWVFNQAAFVYYLDIIGTLIVAFYIGWRTIRSMTELKKRV